MRRNDKYDRVRFLIDSNFEMFYSIIQDSFDEEFVQIFTMYHVERLTFEYIASELLTSINTVKKKYYDMLLFIRGYVYQQGTL